MNDKKALLLGVNHYSGYFKSLSSAVNDAVELKRLLSNNDDGSLNFDCELLLDDYVQKEEVFEKLKILLSSDVNTVLFYFAGHGDDDKKDGYIVCSGNQTISMKQIAGLVNKSKVKNKIIILDCCFAGKMGNCNVIGDTTKLSGGTIIMTSCSGDEKSSENLKHGYFSQLLIEALEGKAADVLGHVTPANIYSYVDRCLSSWSSQRPYFKANVKQFISLRDTNPKLSIRDLKMALNLFEKEDEDLPLDPSFEFTNSPDYKQPLLKPYANNSNVKKLKQLQKLESLGLVEPIGEEHMYFAAINSKSCRLTSAGKLYWKLNKTNRLK